MRISRLSLAALLAVFLCCAQASAADAYRRVVLFEGTQYPLAVHFLRGEEPGPTVMVQGGIQGDEVSGYLTAQLLTRAEVLRGNLIVIPRANVPTVLAKKRQINVDLNRRFDKDYSSFYEDRLARAIRFLLERSNAFVHLHEGSGFYNPTYVDGLRNPRRYGQSIIIDTPVYANRINLAEVATSVLAKLNHSIVPAYQFQLFNTDTFASGTAHPEQRKSLTYHALSCAGIPALAIEVSKNISQVGQKVLWQLRATALTLEQYGVSLRLPEISEQDIEKQAFSMPGVRINGRRVAPGDRVTLSLPPDGVLDVSADPEDGSLFEPVRAVFAADRPNLNLLESPRLALRPFSSLDVQADGSRVARVDVAWKGVPRESRGGKPLFVCWLNGALRFVPAGGTLDAVEGDQLVLEGVWGGSKSEEVLNFKGFVSQPGRNDGQDAGEEIILDPAEFIARYMAQDSESKRWVCRVVRETPGSGREDFHIRLAPRTVSALRLVAGDGDKVLLPWTPDGTAALAPGEYVLDDLWGNGPRAKITVTSPREPLPWGAHVTVSAGEPLELTLRQATTFRPLGHMTLVAR
ncbi:M99 family carboxypeptidase catalytic domain-containing protein [Desulfocurvus sp. DL9XJH121]